MRDLIAHHDTLRTIADALLKARAVLEQEFKAIEKHLSALARANELWLSQAKEGEGE